MHCVDINARPAHPRPAPLLPLHRRILDLLLSYHPPRGAAATARRSRPLAAAEHGCSEETVQAGVGHGARHRER